jgi:hypothetical protein
VGKKHSFSLVLKVPRQCPFVLLVEIRLRKGKGLRSEKVNVSGRGLCYEQNREVEPGFLLRMFGINFYMTLEGLH